MFPPLWCVYIMCKGSSNGEDVLSVDSMSLAESLSPGYTYDNIPDNMFDSHPITNLA